mgnify:CR=1 FL=1
MDQLFTKIAAKISTAAGQPGPPTCRILDINANHPVVLGLKPEEKKFDDWSSVLLGVGLSAMVGLFFGIYPARQAARLDPIDGLRSEK